MRIGIDAKWYFNGPPSGQVVVKNLVDNIILSNPSFKIYLFIDKANKKDASKLWGEKVTIIPTLTTPNLFSNLFLLPYLSWKFKLDIVLFQNFAGFLFNKCKGIVYIHDILFLDYPSFYSLKERLYLSPIRFLAKRANYIITISKSEKERLIRHKIGKVDNIDVIYHGVSQSFKPISNYSENQLESFENKYQIPERYLLYVGRINIRKNLLNLIKALPYLRDKKIKLLIVGGVNHKNINLSNTIKEYNLEERIQFTGHIPEKDLYILYARSTLFCFPSYAEGFGLPPLEAMKCGIPVITSDRTSLPEVCGTAALYVNPDNPKDIANKIDMLLLDPVKYAQKSQESLLHSNNFTWVKSSLEIIRTFEKNYDS
ncbi:glycosyltransferase family 1 protein [Spirosoma harenae]